MRAVAGCFGPVNGVSRRNRSCAEVGRKVASVAKPMDNTDLDLYWRKDVVSEFVGYALREIRGDDMRATRVRIARHDLKEVG